MPSTYIKLPDDPLASSIVLLLIVLGVASITSFITGYKPRDYPTLPSSAVIKIAGRSVLIEQMAYDFKPLLFRAPENISPPAVEMWWEAVDAGDSIALVYHPVWQNERHPVLILHWVYSVYRAVVYGLPLRDIEYIQINVARSNGCISRVKYEGSSSLSYYSWFINHTFITVDKKIKDYIKTETLASNNSKVETVRLNGPQLHFGVVSWSHQFTLLDDNSEKKYVFPVVMPIVLLTDENYTKFKLARRSQGDFVTKEGFAGRAAKFIVAISILGVPYLISKFFYSDSTSAV